ncbi:efflux RND transporter permease subunit [Hyphomonas sp.]|uniref:efflux RND transporter permease subunit n=1 Tax=Hyphomonas sp. TaxID=87 RepID=UPI00391D92EE
MQDASENRGLDPWLVLLRRPRLILALCLAVILSFTAGLPGVVKDPSVDAFVPEDHRFAIARDEAKQIFGLEDPIIIGIASTAGGDLFNPDALTTLRRLDEAVREIPGVLRNEVRSLASIRAIWGEDYDLAVDWILPEYALTPQSAGIARQRAQYMPMLTGSLISGDASLATIIVPVEDPNNAYPVLVEVKALIAAEAGANPGIEIHVAGVAAMNARLADTVDSDTRIFIPAAVVVVLLIVFLTLRRITALAGPLLVIAGSAGIAIGLLGWVGAKYYLITTALPVIIMAIAVADSLHVSTIYLRLRQLLPHLDARTATAMALQRTWVPVTLTSLTTVAGFVGLSFGAAMQPISEFGLFGAVGVLAAWLLSLTGLPSILVLSNLRPGRQAGFLAADHRSTDKVERMIGAISQRALRHPLTSLSLTVLLVAGLVTFALRAEFDYERKRYFAPGDAIVKADTLLNERLGGINFLDVVVSTEAEGGLMTPAALGAIRALRNDMAGLPFVASVTGIDEYISVMHTALTGSEPGNLPVRETAPAQYMFLYESTAPPDDFRETLNYLHTHALVRARLSTDSYQLTKPVVESLEARLAEWSEKNGLQAVVSGRVAVNDGWMSQLADNHFRGLGLALGLILLCAVVMLRSIVFALLAMLPVAVGVLSVYAAMGLLGIDIAPATSMTAAISTGLGIDFGIHLITHLRSKLAAGYSLKEALQIDYRLVGRACFYSAVALSAALAVICLSSAPPLRWFGCLVALGAVGSLAGALLIIPSAFALTRFRFVRRLQNA